MSGSQVDSVEKYFQDKHFYLLMSKSNPHVFVPKVNQITYLTDFSGEAWGKWMDQQNTGFSQIRAEHLQPYRSHGRAGTYNLYGR